MALDDVEVDEAEMFLLAGVGRTMPPSPSRPFSVRPARRRAQGKPTECRDGFQGSG